MSKLLQSVHSSLPLPREICSVAIIRGIYIYYHYACDKVNDKGWGCGYRTLQTICSWMVLSMNETLPPVPSIREVQNCLIQLEDKPNNFMDSKEWIGSFEACLVLDHLYGVSSKILHLSRGSDFSNHVPALTEHFRKGGAPLFVGGQSDNSAKCVVGVARSDTSVDYILVVDPHFVGRILSPEILIRDGWVSWKPVDELHDTFYNVCVPQAFMSDPIE